MQSQQASPRPAAPRIWPTSGKSYVFLRLMCAHGSGLGYADQLHNSGQGSQRNAYESRNQGQISPFGSNACQRKDFCSGDRKSVVSGKSVSVSVDLGGVSIIKINKKRRKNT